jgi:hypothetical protein
MTVKQKVSDGKKKKVSKKAEENDATPDSIPVRKPVSKRVEAAEWYKAKFEKASVEEGNYGQYLILHFTLRSGYLEDSEESAKDEKFVAFVGLPIPPVGDSALMMKGIIGKTVEEDTEIDLTPHYGKSYKVFIDDKTNKKDKSVRQLITKVKRIAKKA